MKKSALVVWGGWDGHDPEAVADTLAKALREQDFDVEISHTLDSFKNLDRLMKLNLIVPVWTMGQIAPDQVDPLCEAVRSGVGIAGCHGGMCDSFRDATEYQFMTGGQWVAHPGNDTVEYTVHITVRNHPITSGIDDFKVVSEQYYLHVDPSNKVLATTHFPVADGPHVPNGEFDMPVIWTRYYGKGKVFYNSVGHNAAVVRSEPTLTLMTRGMLWAAR